MQLLKRAAILGLLVPGAVLAAGPSPVGSVEGRQTPPPHISMPASEESVKRLLQIMGMHELLDENLRQVDERISAGLQRELGGRTLTPEQEAIMIRTHDKISAVVKESISWEVMEPMAIRIYRDALTQDELDGMLAFYKTPAGKAVIKKLPRLTQAMSEEMQRMFQSMMPKLGAIAKESEEEMKLAAPTSDRASPSSSAHFPSASPSSTIAPLESPAPSTTPGPSPSSPDK
jgi:hypothetical protein